MVINDKKILREVYGEKLFTKTKYHIDINLDNFLSANELFMENSPLLVNGNLHLQLVLRVVV